MTAGGVQGGGVQVQPAPSGRRVHQVKAGLLAGLSIKGLAKQLGISRASVQEHARRLLETGELVKADGRYCPGTQTGLQGGVQVARYTRDLTPVQGTHHPDVATDGRRTFRIVQPPALVDRVPGFQISKPKGQRPGRPVAQMLHHVAHTDTHGRTWNLWLEQSIAKGRWSLWVGQVLPPPRFQDFQKPGETPDDAVDRLTVQVVVDWAAKAGVGLVPVPRRTRPVSVAFPGVVPPGMTWKDDQTTADGTPPHANGWNTLELQGPDAERTRLLQKAVRGLPETTGTVANHGDQLQEMDRLLAELGRRVLQHLELDVRRETAATQLAIAHTVEGIAARPSPSFPRPPSPWEFI